MIERLFGELVYKAPTMVHVQTGPFWLEVAVPLSTSQKLPEAGGNCELWTHLIWREDGPSLFGFLTRSERDLFRLLILVQGVGPRIALSVLSHMSPAELVQRIRGRSVEDLTRVPGIGPKTAGRILVELGPRVDRLDLTSLDPESPRVGERSGHAGEDAVQALTALGYPAREARATVAGLLRSDPDLPLAECVRQALRAMAG